MPVNVVSEFRWTTVRDAIIAEMELVESVKLIHPYLRWDGNLNSNEQRFLKKFIAPGGKIINAWALSRGSEIREYLTNREILAQIIVQLDFWYEIDDDAGSQDTFDNIVDDVLNQFEEPIRLSDTVELQGPMQMPTSDHRYFAGRLTHHAELTSILQHRIHVTQFR